MKTLQALGMDGPVTYAFLARLTNIAGSAGTVLLIARFLSPVEQGYYYTLLSLVSLQIVFELGFSFVIQQLAAHECVHLDIDADGKVSGDETAHARLASALQLSVRWYTRAVAAMALFLAPLGVLFFSRSTDAPAPHVAWQGPWLAAALASSASLWCVPFYAFLEGCGHVRAVAAMRLRQSLAAVLSVWPLLLMHRGLYAPAMVVASQIAIGLLYIAGHRRLLAGLFRHRPGGMAIEWKREVWPFQWRIAVSWMCSYFTVQALIPILFALRSPVEAGQMGMSLSITGYMTGLVLPWISTKATAFGRMIADGEFRSLDQLFQRTFRQALTVFGLVALGVCAGAAMLPVIAPRLAGRIVRPQSFALLVLAAGANCAVQSFAILLRSFRREPYLIQSLIVASLTTGIASLTAGRWGASGAAFGYFAATAGFALPSSLAIFSRARRRYLAIAVQAAFAGEG